MFDFHMNEVENSQQTKSENICKYFSNNRYPTEMSLKGHDVVLDGGRKSLLMADFSLFMHAGPSSHTPGTSVVPQTTTEGRCQPSAPAPL